MHFSSTKSLFSTVAHVTDKLPGLERDELEFLKEKKFIVQEPDHYVPASERSMDHFIDLPLDQDYISEALRKLEADYRIPNLHQKEFIDQMRMDVWTRLICAHIERGTHTIPVCRLPIPEKASPKKRDQHSILSIGLQSLPVPGDTSAWQDILTFKEESWSKRWTFRRFLRTLATTRMSEAEISDELEGTLHDYPEAMKLHQLKSQASFAEMYILPVLELAEDVLKLNWSKIAKGALSIRKRQIELTEGEMKADGRECAYVFDVRKRFGAAH